MNIIKEQRIAEQNDWFRKKYAEDGVSATEHGKHIMTRGCFTLPMEKQLELIKLVQGFDKFTEDNDPYGQHDFGSVDMDDTKYFWKIDYYDTEYKYGSPAANDPSVTRRILTIMRSDEY